MTMASEHIPRVSVLMSVYNGECYLREAIDSILEQTFCDFEFLIIDDGSTDSSHKIIYSYSDPRIRLIENRQNIGLTKSLNLGLSMARGEYIARQDADDRSLPTRFEKQVDYLDKYPDIAVLGTEARYIDKLGKLLQPSGWVRSSGIMTIRWQCMFESPFIHSSVMMRCNIARDECGGYNVNSVTSQDHELWTRIVYRHNCSNLIEPLIDFRTHPGSVSSLYTADRMKTVAITLQQAACFGLGHAPPDDWVDLWIRINNTGLFRETPDIDSLAMMIDVMHDSFVKLNPGARESDEIRQHKNIMLMRVAYNSATTDRVASFALFRKIYQSDPKTVRTFFFKYILVLIFGKKAAQFYRKIRNFLHT